MFGEPLDRSVLDRAFDAAAEAGVFMAIGTSLRVHPAASRVDVAVESGARLLIVNAEPTPYDELADDVVRESIETAVPALIRSLEGQQ